MPALLVALWFAGAGTSTAAPRVTVFGDSVQASFQFTPQAPRILRPGIDLRLEASVCRRLTGSGCLGGRPPSVLTLAGALGPRLGDVVVVHVGYNDSASAYDIEAVLRAFARARVRAVVWVTLRERHGGYARTNARIRNAAARLSGRRGYPLIRIADWNAASVGRPWFVSDGIHLNGAGAIGLAGLLRGSVVRTLAELDIRVGGPPVVLPTRTIALRHRVRRLAADRGAVWAAGGGRLTRLGERGGRRSRLSESSLASDGRRAWLLPASGGVSRAAGGGLRVDTGAPATGVAWAGSTTWFLTPCPGTGSPPCPSPADLRSVGGRPRTTVPLAGVPTGLAGSQSGLWVGLPAGGGRGLIELRAPRTGRLVRTVPLGPGGRVRQIAASDQAAFVVHGDGRLRLVTRAGRVRVVMRGVAAVTSDSRSEVWALDALRGRAVRLHPADGRVLARADVGRRAVARSSQLALTGSALWVGGPSSRILVRVPVR